jgi:hypothetical protein
LPSYNYERMHMNRDHALKVAHAHLLTHIKSYVQSQTYLRLNCVPSILREAIARKGTNVILRMVPMNCMQHQIIIRQ